jgi:hypothetical protein
MSAQLKWVLSAVMVPLLASFGGAVLGSYTQIARLEERIAAVKEYATLGVAEAKASALSAHERIDFFSRGGG